MSKLAIFGDIHGNLPALEAVLADIELQPGIDQVSCLGDLVGYAPFPNEVIEWIQDLGIVTLMGNYDDGVGFDRDDCGCAYRTAEERERGERSFVWTKTHVTEANKALLRTLLSEVRLTVRGRRILLVHGSPRRINEYLYEDRPLSSFERLANSSNADVIIFGHTHLPYTKQVNDVLFVNAGSVGKPKDVDPRACYAVIDVTDKKVDVSFQRVAYDIPSVVQKIRMSDLPDEFATMLEQGRG